MFQKILKKDFGHRKCLEGPLEISFLFYVPIPKRTSSLKKERMLAMEIFPDKRPDLTNYIKFSEDTLKGIVIKDDSQVVDILSCKRYSEDPRTTIIVKEIQCL